MPIDAQEKLAGVLIPTFALRSGFDLGIGDTDGMRQAIDFCQKQHLSVLQILPINETGGDNSPYNAISSMALDPALLSMRPETVPGLSNSDLLKLAPEAVRNQLNAGAIDYPSVKRLKWDLLGKSFESFRKHELVSPSSLGDDFEQFKQTQKSWLPAYCLFRTIMQLQDGNACWNQWPSQWQTYDQARQWLNLPENQKLLLHQEFYAYVQWAAYRQWQDVKAYAEQKNVRLMGDIPFGISRYSADVWADRELFDLDWSGGAPPETYFQHDPFIQKWGQNWGIPLYCWPQHEQTDFSWWRQRVKYLANFFHYFRIDHVLGFFRIYAFPWQPERNAEFLDLTPAQAAELTNQRLPQFLPGPDSPPESALQNRTQGKRLLEMVLEAAGSMGVVAEDLGVVPDYVRPLLQELGIPGFYIPIFERHEQSHEFKAAKDIPALTLGTYATHDHAPLLAFYEELVERWHGHDGHDAWLDMQRLMRYLGRDAHHPPKTWSAELSQGFQQVLLYSPCWLAMFMITDILGGKQRFNQPGSSSQSNWSERLSCPLQDYAQDPQIANQLENLAKLIDQSRRIPLVAKV